MYEQATYNDVVDEVLDELRESIAFAQTAGVSTSAIVVDPGFGFAKQAPHSYELLARLDELSGLGRPVLAGPSRKGFLTRPLSGEVSTAPIAMPPRISAMAMTRDRVSGSPSQRVATTVLTSGVASRPSEVVTAGRARLAAAVAQ